MFLLIGVTACAVNSPQVSDDSEPSTLVTAEKYVAPVTSQTTKQEPVEKQYDDLWERIRDGFKFPQYRDKYVEEYEKWYANRPEYMQRMVKRAEKYLFYIVEELEKHDFPMEIALLPAIESAFKPTAYSRAHAAGLWQFIAPTARRYGVKQNWWYDGRLDVIAATDAAIQYLTFLNQEFSGDWFHSLASYNGGERRVMRAIASNKKAGKPSSFPYLKLRSETRRYIPKLIAIKNIVSNPQRFGLKLDPIPNRPYFELVHIGSQIDLGVVAKLIDVPAAELHQLNTGFRRWATDPDGPHRLIVPVGKKSALIPKLASLPAEKRMRWARYQIRKGDTLGQIARRYGVSVRAIQTANKLSGTLIRAGHALLIPVSSGTLSSSSLAYASGNTSSSPLVHRVRRGETLWGIARKYNVYVAQLRRWNTMGNSNLLQLGQKLLVYVN